MLPYCPPNVSISQPWLNHGISDCFMETVAFSIILGYILIFGVSEYIFYMWYSTRLDGRMLRRPWLFVLQICLLAAMPFLQLAKFAAGLQFDQALYGYRLLTLIFSAVVWAFAARLVFLERKWVLPSPPSYGHGLALIVFWGLVLVKQCLEFFNLHQTGSLFQIKTLENQIRLAIFVITSLVSLAIFVIGMRAPGIPQSQDYYVFNWSRHHRTSTSEEGRLLEEPPQPTRSALSRFWRTIRRLLPFVWPKKNVFLQMRVIFCLLLLALGRVVNLYVPIYNRSIVNSLTGPNPRFCWDFILIYTAFWFLQGQGGNSFLNNFRTFLWIRVQQYTVKELEVELFSHILRLSLRWHLGRKTGAVLRIMDRGTSSITSLLSYIVFNILPALVDIIVAIIFFSLYFDLWFGLIIFLTMAVYMGATIGITEWRTKFRRTMNQLDNAKEARGVDALINFETVKYYNAETYEINRYQESVDDFQVMEWKSSASLNLLNTAQNVTITLGVLAGSLLCVHYIVGGRLTVGDYVLFSTYLVQLYTPLNQFGTYYRLIQTAFIDMENLFELFAEKPEIQDEPDARTLHIHRGEITFNDVTFEYTPGYPILKNISFVVPAGKKFAIVGPSGVGKSTLIRLLFRFYDPTSGVIYIDGQDISTVTQESLREHIGVVPQDTVLFNQDIRYNIRYGKVEASEEEVMKAAEAADIHTTIINFPQGYDTLVGERGLKLSGGEKQRVAIARTVLKSPEIILLDEATSSLDTHTERNIQASLNIVCHNKTTLVIAHRLSTIVDADEILVLKDSEIVERGSHEKLLALGQVYASMWHQQIQAEQEAVSSILT